MKHTKLVLIIISLLTLPFGAAALPCDNVHRDLPSTERADLTHALAERNKEPNLRILEYFNRGDWSIIYVDTGNADPGFEFYAKSPLDNPYVTVWGGGAGYNETSEIEQWAFQNAKGIPKPLAACFAWYVTKGRTQ